MIEERFLATSTLFEVCQVSKIEWIEVESALLEKFSKAVQDFEYFGRPFREVPILDEAIRELRKQRRNLSVVPTRFSDPFFDTATSLSRLRLASDRVGKQFPSEVVDALQISIEILEEINYSSDAPLLDAIQSQCSVGAVVIVPKRYFQSVSQVSVDSRLGRRRVRVMTPNDFEEHPPVDLLLLCGSTHWYRGRYQYLLLSPQARQTLITHWSWIHDAIPSDSFLKGSLIQVRGKLGAAPRNSSQIEGDEILAAVDWFEIHRDIHQAAGDQGDTTVSARAVLLAGGLLSAIATAGESRELILLPDDTGDERVQEVLGSDIRPGDFLVRRTQGSDEEFIESIADGLMGPQKAVELRAMQSAWKAALRSVVDAYGEDAVVQKLRLAGSQVVSNANLRNWMSESFIVTKDRRDFDAILEVCGLRSNADELWKSMRLIHGKHVSAGFKITEMLRTALEAADSSQANRFGRVDITLPHEGAGTASAFRVEAISPVTIRVASHLLRRVIRGGAEWLE